MTNAPSLRDLDRLADRIRLSRQVDKRPVAIVEGPSDKRILSRGFQDQEISYFPAGTRKKAIEAAKELTQAKQVRFACVVDRDFDDEVAVVKRSCRRIHPYDNADLEGMLATSQPGIDLLDELGSAPKVQERGGVEAILAQAGEVISPVARLRRANNENNWYLAFDQVDLAGKIERKTMTLKTRSYCTALSQTSSSSPGVATLMEYADGKIKTHKTPACPNGSSPFVRGRDFLAALSVALSGYCGTKKPQSVQVESLAEALRLAGAHELRNGRWAKDFLALLES